MISTSDRLTEAELVFLSADEHTASRGHWQERIVTAESTTFGHTREWVQIESEGEVLFRSPEVDTDEFSNETAETARFVARLRNAAPKLIAMARELLRLREAVDDAYPEINHAVGGECSRYDTVNHRRCDNCLFCLADDALETLRETAERRTGV